MVSIDKLEKRDAAAKAKRAKKPVLEKEVEGPVKDYARAKGLYVRKFQSENNRSVPDDIFGTPKGVVFFIEFKRPGKKPTPAQADEHELMRKKNLKVHVIDNVQEGKALIDQYLEDDAWL